LRGEKYTVDNLVFFATPVRDKGEFLPQYLEGLYMLNYPKRRIECYFLVNDSDDNSLKILTAFGKTYGGYFKRFEIDVQNFDFPKDLRMRSTVTHCYAHLADLRNRVREKFVKSNCQYWLQVDADHPLTPESLNILLAQDKGYICGWTEHYQRGRTNVLVRKEVFNVRNPYRILKADEISSQERPIMVDWVGGIALVRRDVADLCRYYVPFSDISVEDKNAPKPPTSFEYMGKTYRYFEENLGFCLEVQKLGETCWVHPEVKIPHLGSYEIKDLPEKEEARAKIAEVKDE
jgi:hypothetical protein